MKVTFAHVLMGGLLAYFTYHAMAGEQGLARWTSLQKKHEVLIAERDALQREKAAIESRLERLRADQLDLDYVEELARVKLSYAHPEDLVISLK